MPIGGNLADATGNTRLPRMRHNLFDCVGLPAANGHGRTHLDLECAFGLAVRHERLEPFTQWNVRQALAQPIDVGALGQISE